jgi:hypothetical protein
MSLMSRGTMPEYRGRRLAVSFVGDETIHDRRGTGDLWLNEH